MKNSIYTLPSTNPSGSSTSLRCSIEAGLRGTSAPTVPGSTAADAAWAFKRSVPTVVLYDEQGLRLYDRITSDAPEYYLFEDELNLFKTYGAEIARAMGFPGMTRTDDGHDDDSQHDDDRERQTHVPAKPWKPARWGDADVGKFNNGVNGEEGLGGGWDRGYDVVELGAGALRKTAFFLSALADALPNAPVGAAPIAYHPLDLSLPELDRVLGEMDDDFGARLGGKVDCIGLHGDYEAGLEFIRSGRLAELRENSARGRARKSPGGLGLDAVDPPSTALSLNRTESLPESPLPVTPHQSERALNPSPTFSPLSAHIVTPDADCAPFPATLADFGKAALAGTAGRPWSPDSSASVSALPVPPRPLHLVFLGSSLGNFERDAAPAFLRSLPLKPGDTLLIGLDGRPAPGPEGCRKVEVAYNDPHGHTRAFEEHGWDVVRAELGLTNDAGIDFVGRYNEVLGRHEAYFKSRDRQTIPLSDGEVQLEKGELLNIEWSYKYSYGEALELFDQASLLVINSWKAPDSEYRLWLLERPNAHFMSDPTPVALDALAAGPIDRALSVGKWHDWETMWKLWDHITLEMIPEDMLHQKPIDLRHICLFYLGHIPTFLDMFLARATDGVPTEPATYRDIFERGIDPDVDDPNQCHTHSEVPKTADEWPTLSEILAFRDRVRARVRRIYADVGAGRLTLSRSLGRHLFMGLEHEAMHAETLLYMLLQAPSTRAPSMLARPQWDVLARHWAREADTHMNKVLAIPAGDVVLGHDDAEHDDAAYPTAADWEAHEFGWDNEHPRTAAHVPAFEVDSLPVTNAEYAAFLGTVTAANAPASWVALDGADVGNGGWAVRTLYGPVGFDVAGKWPLMASKQELDAFAAAKGGRMPTEPELRRLWQTDAGPRPAELTANIGFKNWHPIPPTNTVADHAGHIVHGHNGGVWEWTSTPHMPLSDGYVQSKLYPGYAADFFDHKHYVVLGGSYASSPTFAARPSFRNFYQYNYRYAFIGGRVAYDA
ncbi:hypothetical protein Q5752_006214 [Cryptotrichosporon argae]